jgi:hypothetical protein
MGAGGSAQHLDPVNIISIVPPKINTNNLIYNKEMFKGGGKIRINKKNNNIYNTIAIIIILLYFILLFIYYIFKK